MITQAINLNLIPGQVLPRVNVSQYDSGTRTLQMTLFNGEQIFNVPSGASGFIQGTKPDRTGFQYAATVTAGSNIVTIDITQQMTAVKGEVVCELVLANDDDRIATVNFILYVEAAALADDTVISETDLPLIEEAAELAERIDGIVQQVDEDAQTASNAADKAEAYGTHPPYIGANGNWFVYNVTTQQYEDSGVKAQGPLSGLTDVEIPNAQDGQEITYDGTTQKWKNTSKIQTLTNQVSAEATTRANADAALGTRIDEIIAPSGEAPSAAEVTDARIGEDGVIYASLGTAIRSQVTQLDNVMKDNGLAEQLTGWVNNKRCNTDGPTIGNPATNTAWRYLSVACAEGDMFVINSATTANSFRAWTFTDSNGTILSKRSSGNATNELIVAPTNAAMLYVNDPNSGGNCYKGVYSKYSMALFNNAAIPITSGDFNDFKTAGNYKITSSSIMQTLSNRPTDIAGRLEVLEINTINAIEQIFLSTRGEIFFRYGSLSSGKWLEWKEIASIANVKSMIDTADEEVRKQNDIIGRAAYHNILALRKQATYDMAFANAFVPLSLNNYLGNNQNVHPKVLYFENGFGGHNYWMAYTPYPYSNDTVENPCVAYSDDGYAWTNIEGNPLAEAGNTVTIDGVDYQIDYNSDTHLVYRDDTSTLECWYRGVVESPKIEVLFRRTTTDGITWTNPEVMLTDSGHNLSQFLSPAIEWDGSNYLMWVCGFKSGSRGIDFYSASGTNPTNWTYVRTFALTYDDDGLSVGPWHLDVIRDNNTYIMLVMCRNGKQIANNACSLFVATSQDNITYTTPQKIVGGADSWDKYMYRSSIVKVGNKYRIYYSAGSGGTTTIYNNAVWGIGITESSMLSNFIGCYE